MGRDGHIYGHQMVCIRFIRVSLYCCDGLRVKIVKIRGKARGLPLYPCLPAQLRHLLRLGMLLPRPRSPSYLTKQVHAIRLGCPRLHHLHRFPVRQRYSSLRAAYLRPNRSHETQYRSSLITNDHLHECCVLVLYWWYWHYTGTSAYNLVVHILKLIKYEHFDTYDDDGHRVYFL